MADHVGSAGSSRSGGLGGTQFGDTTLTKVFVGGLAWETDRDTMRRYFEQFGDILEAVVITDKNTGRSKGYGFVTFRDPESARRACVDPTPVIDGRRANCNLASLGVRHRFGTPIYTGGRFRPAAAAPRFGATPAYVSTYAQSGAFAYQQGYYPYSYATYTPEYYAQNLYAPYAALPQFYGSPNPAIYTYPGLGQPLQMPTSYTNLPQQYGFQGSHLIPYNSGTAISSIATVPPYLAGISTPTSVPSPGITTPAPIPQQFSVPAPSIPPYSLGSGAIQSSS